VKICIRKISVGLDRPSTPRGRLLPTAELELRLAHDTHPGISQRNASKSAVTASLMRRDKDGSIVTRPTGATGRASGRLILVRESSCAMTIWASDNANETPMQMRGAVSKHGTDDPSVFSAYLRTLRWNTATAADRDLFQAPFRAGIHQDASRLDAEGSPRSRTIATG